MNKWIWLPIAAAACVTLAALAWPPPAHLVLEAVRVAPTFPAARAQCPPGTLPDLDVCIPAPLPEAATVGGLPPPLGPDLPRSLSLYQLPPARDAALRPWPDHALAEGLTPRGLALRLAQPAAPEAALGLRAELEQTHVEQGPTWALTRHRLATTTGSQREVYSLRVTSAETRTTWYGFYQDLPGATYTSASSLVDASNGLNLDPRSVLPLVHD